MQGNNQNTGLPANLSLSGFFGNLGTDVGNIITGLPKIPGALYQAGQEAAKQFQANPTWGLLGPGALMAKTTGLADEYNQLLGSPIQTQGGGTIQSGAKITGVGLPNIGAAVGRAYNKPATTALDILPFFGGGKGPAETPPAAEPSGLTQAGNRFLQGQYNLKPTTAMKLDASGTVGKLADWGITKPSDVARAADAITGSDGILTKMVREAIGKSKPIDTSGLQDMATNLIQNSELIPDSIGNKALTVIQKGVQKILGTGQVANPLDAFDFMKSLEAKGSQFVRAMDPATKQLGQFYHSMANELENRIFSGGANDIGLSSVISPENLNQISRISPKLAEAVKNAGSIGDLRSLQAPFVRGSQMVEETLSKAGSLPMNMKDILALGTAALRPETIPLMLAETGMGKNLVGNILRGASGTVPAVGGVSRAISPLLTTGQGLPDQNNAQNVQADQYHTGSISQGINKYQVPQLPSGFLTGNDYNSQKNTITQQIANMKMTDPIGATKLQGQLDQLDNSWNQQQPIRDTWTNTNKIATGASAAFNIIKRADPSILNLNGTLDSLLKSTNPEYAALGVALQNIQQLTGVNLASSANKEALLSALDYAVSTANNNYNSTIQQYFGGQMPQQGSSSFRTGLPAINSVPAPVTPDTSPAPLPANMLQGPIDNPLGLPPSQ